MILVNDKKVIKRFPNGEAVIAKFKIFDFNKITLKYESDADLFDLLLVRKALPHKGVSLDILYMPYSRMDRYSEDYIFTLKSVCDYINWLNFDIVWLRDPHSEVTPALINNVDTTSLMEQLLENTTFDIKKDCVLYPDAGAYKKYADIINAPNVLVGMKKRDFKTGKITELQIVGDPLIEGEELAGKRVFIIDDLCSKGGTFTLAAEQLKRMGAGEINLVVVHCESNIFNGEIFNTDLISRVYTTNTILNDNHDEIRLKVVNVM